MQIKAGIKTTLLFLIECSYLVGLRSAQEYRLLLYLERIEKPKNFPILFVLLNKIR
jgi:hypothetical protein